MSAIGSETVKSVEQQTEEFIERLLRSTAGVFDMFSIYIGERLGFYRVLAEAGPLTVSELAARTQTQPRYVREWLEQQAVSGILQVQNKSDPQPKFYLSEAHREVLTATDSLNYLAPLGLLVAGVVRPLENLLTAYRTGGGVPYSAYGADLREGQAGINRAMFLKSMGTEWLPAIPELHARLQAEPPARVADLGCGAGWSSIGIAQSYPQAMVDGFDLDEPSIKLAQANAAAADLGQRINFQVRDAGDPALAGQYDLVTAFECVHDMSNPVAALEVMYKLVSPTGTVLVVDERVGESFAQEWGEVDWMMYGWSILHCLPVGMADEVSAQTGTVMRADTLRGYAQAAGFRDIEVLPIENFFFRFYRLNK